MISIPTSRYAVKKKVTISFSIASAMSCRPHSRSRTLCRWALRRGHGGEEHLCEAGGVGIEEVCDSPGVGRADDEAGVVVLLHAEDNLGGVEGTGVRVGGMREAEHASRIVLGDARQG